MKPRLFIMLFVFSCASPWLCAETTTVQTNQAEALPVPDENQTEEETSTNAVTEQAANEVTETFPEPPVETQPEPVKTVNIQVGDSKEDVLTELGKPKGDMRSRKGWELLIYERGEVELTDGVVSRVSFRTPEEVKRRNQERQDRLDRKNQAEEAKRLKAKERRAAQFKRQKEDREKSEKDEKAWREAMQERLGKKPVISGKKRKKLRNAGKWYWNSDGSIDWEKVKANPPPEPGSEAALYPESDFPEIPPP